VAVNYNYKQCPICRAWLSDDGFHQCGTVDKINPDYSALPVASNHIQTIFLDEATKDYLRRIAEALEELVKVFGAPPEFLKATKHGEYHENQ